MHPSTILFSFAAFAVGNAVAVSIPRDSSGFGDFASGRGSALFGNAGTACTVGNDEGECDQFGRCAQFIPPNESSILNQGRSVAACVAGGQTGTLKM
ncbi:hypothetical protein B0J13DRAFT_557518 [Dactylonectria estremocensis]|uniref:Uncharacterized protein n=1 Tax=Dactylonectria estremocensis TaxID=1079267 RepID=A0A9P9ENL0_9HYPO|nr:hypothetical protein B0J13DRAFT_557518 [Dactylonectria estremocensis]